MHHKSNIFPFTAIVGQELMKLALILNAINPKIGGVLIKGEKGTAKSTAVRSMTELLPKIKIVADCPFVCNPENINEMCTECTKRFKRGEKFPVVEHHMKMITLPVSATEDRVVGTIDLKKALEKKKLSLEPGILAEVNRGILYIDEVNLLDNHVADILLDAAAMGYNIIERENISFFHPSNFILIGTMNPEEGDLRPQLLDRFGLCIEVKGEKKLKNRIKIIQARQEFDKNTILFKKKYEAEQEKLRNRIINAKKFLPDVILPEEYLEFISLICINFNVDGHRADITIAKTAQTIAAFERRSQVSFEDLKKAMILSLPHRLKKGPFSQQKFDLDEFNIYIDNLKKEFDRKKDLNENKDLEQSETQIDEYSDNTKEKTSEVFDENDFSDNKYPKQDTINTTNEEYPESVEVEEKYDKIESQQKSRSLEDYILDDFKPNDYKDDFYNSEEIIFEVGGGITDQARKDILKQKISLIQQRSKSRNGLNQSLNRSGKYSKFRYPFKKEKINDLAIDATLRAAIIDSIKHNQKFKIESQHYRIKVRKSPTNILIIFLLDTSGSMAANKRMSAAKGALLSLLKNIYIRKDKICLITFSGKDANLIIPPTNSVELASEILPKIPTGGKTPLSAAINKAINIAISEQNMRGIIPLIILLSDCKQNISLYSLNDDLEMLNDKIERYSIPLIVIDTDLSDFNLGFAKEVSEKLNAIYYQLEKLQADKIASIITSEYDEMTKILDKI